MEDKKEIWKFINGVESGYQISNSGRIKLLPYIRVTPTGTMGYTKEKIVVGSLSNKYRSVDLKRIGAGKAYVHRLVAEAFLPNPENKKTVNHKNGVKTDNRVENLEWATHSENKLHAFRTGLTVSQKGEMQHSSKLTTKQVEKIIKLRKTGKYSMRELGEMFSVKSPTIVNIVNRKTWKHLNLKTA